MKEINELACATMHVFDLFNFKYHMYQLVVSYSMNL